MVEEQGRAAKLRLLLVIAIATVLVGSVVALAANDDGGSPAGDVASGGDTTVPEVGAVDASSTATSAPNVPSSVAAATTTSVTKPPEGKKGSDKGTSSTTSSTISPHSGEYRFEVTVDPLCVVIGAPLTVTLRLRPGHSGGLIAAYADGSSHTTRHIGFAGDDGLLTWTGPAAPAPGPAIMLTQGTDENGKTGGTRVEFLVVETPGEC